MTYLSQLRLNGSRPGIIRLLRSDENIHACIASCTPDDGRTLWRMDQTSSGRIIYVVSEDRPDFTGFKERYGYPNLPDKRTFRTADYDMLLDSLKPGQSWFFETVVNPTIKHRGSVIPLITREPDSNPSGTLTASEWLTRKLSDAAEITDLRLKDDSTSLVLKRGNRLKIRKVRYEGMLNVVNPDALKTVLTGGLGREKAYGCGLITLAKG